MKQTAFLAAAVAALANPVLAADVRIADIKAFLFLERTGKLSSNIIGAPAFIDLAKGGGNQEPATGVFLDLTFTGEKNSAPKYATATVNLIQTGKEGQQIVTHRAFTNFIFGADGIQHKALFIEGATCKPVSIEVKTPKAEKSAKLDFECKEQSVSSPAASGTLAVQ